MHYAEASVQQLIPADPRQLASHRSLWGFFGKHFRGAAVEFWG